MTKSADLLMSCGKAVAAEKKKVLPIALAQENEQYTSFAFIQYCTCFHLVGRQVDFVCSDQHAAQRREDGRHCTLPKTTKYHHLIAVAPVHLVNIDPRVLFGSGVMMVLVQT